MSSTLRSVPVRRFAFASPSSSRNGAVPSGAPVLPATPRMFRSLSPAPFTKSDSNSNAAVAAAEAANDKNNGAAAAAADETTTPAVAAPEEPQQQQQFVQPSPSRSVQQQQQQQQSISQPPAPPSINLDNFEHMPPVRGVLNSPRSLKACANMQIRPSELVARPLNDFIAHGVPRSMAVMRRDHFEKQRVEKIAMLRGEREQLPVEQMPVAAPTSTNAMSASSQSIPSPANGLKTKPAATRFGGGGGSRATMPTASSASKQRSSSVDSSKNQPLRRSSSASSTGSRGSGRVASRPSTPTQQQQQQQQQKSANAGAAAARRPPSSPVVRSATPVQRSATNVSQRPQPQGLSRSATPVMRSASAATQDLGHFSPAKQHHDQVAAAREHHRQEIANRAKMEQSTKDLRNIQRIAQQQRQREVTMRKMLRDRLMESEKKRLDIEDSLAHAQRQRRLKDVEAERARLAAARRAEQKGTRDPFQVEAAKEAYKSPASRRAMAEGADPFGAAAADRSESWDVHPAHHDLPFR